MARNKAARLDAGGARQKPDSVEFLPADALGDGFRILITATTVSGWGTCAAAAPLPMRWSSIAATFRC